MGGWRDYDDVLILPEYSEVTSRRDVGLDTRITKNVTLALPLVSAPMDTVTEGPMARALAEAGGMGFIHRYQSVEKQRADVTFVTAQGLKVGAAIGVVGDYMERAIEMVAANATVLLIDVAHGDHILVTRALNTLKGRLPNVDVLVGNIATHSAATRLADAGAAGLRVGVGSGAHCTTRIETGVGVPQLEAIMDCVRAAEVWGIPVCADGGIRFAGDAVKALAAGAETIMCGNVLAGTLETPGHIHVSGYGNSQQRFKEYRGMASHNAKVLDGRKDEHIEGISKMVAYKGPVAEVLSSFEDGIKSGCSYVGASNLKELREKARFIQVTSSAGHLPKVWL